MSLSRAYPARGRSARFLFLALAAFCLLAGCSSGSDDGGSASSEDALHFSIPELYATKSSIIVHVAYEPGAEPYTGNLSGGIPAWSVFEGNVSALFQGRAIEPEVSAPQDLPDMLVLTAHNQEVWELSAIMDLARETWRPAAEAEAAEIHILFLNGRVEEKAGDSTHIIGVSFTGTSVLAIFKQVISASSSSRLVRQYVEQAALIHEAGHIMGLVNRGVPMASPHEDPEHPHHCSNSACVMYWLNEGSADLRLFAQQFMETGSLVMYGPECLNDAMGYLP